MSQIIIRKLPEEVHRALKAQAEAHGRSTEAEARDILARAVAPRAAPQGLGDLLHGLWQGADLTGLDLGRDVSLPEPAEFE